MSSQEDSHDDRPFSQHAKEGDCMKNNDFITITGWVFSLLSLLLAVYTLGKSL